MPDVTLKPGEHEPVALKAGEQVLITGPGLKVSGASTSGRRRITASGAYVPPPVDPPPPPPPPIVLPFPGFAKAEAAVVAGGIVEVPPGIYRERPTLTKRGVTWRLAPGAVVDLTGLGVPIQLAGVTAKGDDITWQGGRITGSAGAAFAGDGARVKLLGTEVDHCIQEGIVWHGPDGLRKDVENHHNNESGQVWNGSEQGAGKAHALRHVIDGEHVHDIGLGGLSPDGGQGLWFDQWYPDGTPIAARELNTGAVVRNCLIERVFYNGIMYEVSRGASFHDNVVHHCGRTPSGNGFWGAGILVSSSQDVDVYGNLLAFNQSGIRVVLQNRADRPGITRNVSLHDNTFIGNQRDAFSFDTDDNAAAAGMFVNGSGNLAYANRFDVPRAYWKPLGALTSITALNALPGGGGNVLLPAATVAAILADKGIAA